MRQSRDGVEDRRKVRAALRRVHPSPAVKFQSMHCLHAPRCDDAEWLRPKQHFREPDTVFETYLRIARLLALPYRGAPHEVSWSRGLATPPPPPKHCTCIFTHMREETTLLRVYLHDANVRIVRFTSLSACLFSRSMLR